MPDQKINSNFFNDENDSESDFFRGGVYPWSLVLIIPEVVSSRPYLEILNNEFLLIRPQSVIIRPYMVITYK